MKNYAGKSVRALSRAVLLPVLVAGYLGCGIQGRGTEGYSIAIMTWNLQLLFDGVEDGTEFRDFREAAGWTREKYTGRLNVIAGAIDGMERKPDIIALQEVESAGVVADLAAALSSHRYDWAHFARNPGAAFGVGLLSRYPLYGVRAHAVNIDGDIAPRPMLEARIGMDEEADGDGFSLVLFLCHWKSKLGGAEETESTRRASARIALRRIRELAGTDPELPVIVVGDLNINHDDFFRRGASAVKSLLPDDPRAAEIALLYVFGRTDPGTGVPAGDLQRDFIVVSHDKPPGARYFPEGVVALYSPWGVEMGDGSFFFRNSWQTIDHFLLSAQLFDGTGWEFYDSRVINVHPFADPEGMPASYNPRTGRGISDHLPLMLFLEMRE